MPHDPAPDQTPDQAPAPRPVREVAAVFLRLGTFAFGGPVAHVAMMRDEVVRRRRWVDDARFADLVGATNLIPGPNSTELAIHLGFERARWRGLVVAGACFIVPAALMVTVLAWLYVEHGTTPAFEGVLRGVVPAVLAVIAVALVGLARTVLATAWLALVAGAALAAYFLGVNELVVMFGGAAATLAAHASRQLARRGEHRLLGLPLMALPVFDDPTGAQLGQLFWTLLKIGSVLYGTGYVLLAFLEGDFVDRLGWVTREQLLDAVSIGQVTPGPTFTTATFMGYLVAGPLGALLATIAIFLPSFVLVGLVTRLAGWLRSRTWTAALLDGLNAAALGLMAGVSVELGRTSLVDPFTVGVTLAALVLLWRTRLNSAWLVLGGAVVGLLESVVLA